MKRNRFIAASAVASIAAGIAGGAAAEEKLAYGSWLPPTHVVVEKGLTPFFDRVAEASSGELTWELFSGGAMGGPKEALSAVKDGLVDASLVVDVYFKRDLPVSVAMSDLFMMVDDQLAWGAALTETQLLDCPQCEAEYDKHGLTPLAFYSGGDYHLMCMDEVHTLEQVAGKKIRATARNGALTESWGAVPVSITTAEMYEAMQRGQADCTIGAYAWLNSYGLKDLVKSIVSTPIGGYYSALVLHMADDRWDGLSDAHKAILLQQIPHLIADINFSYKESGEASAEEARAAGVAFFEMDSAMMETFEQFKTGEIDVTVQKATEAGVDGADAVVAALLENVEKWKGIMANPDMDREAYAKALWDEIYSKL